MLISLSIRNVVLIEKLDISFQAGLCALTGETGAGKSILLDSLGLAMGARADRGLVRSGESQASVAAVFDIPNGHRIWTVLDEHGLGTGPDLILRRVQGADGRSRAFINDQPVSVGTLRDVGDLLLEIHGQHDDRGLLNPSAHRELLDMAGGLGPSLEKTKAAFENWSAASTALEALRRQIAKADEDEDYLRHVIAELERLEPRDDEEDALADERQRLMNAEKISEDLSEAQDALAGEGGVERRLQTALRSLEQAAKKSPGSLEPVIESIDRALVEAAEARASIGEAARSHQADDQRLELVEERLFALRAAARKHQVQIAELPRLLVSLSEQLSGLTTAQDDLAAYEARVAAAKDAYMACAKTLSLKRKAAAKKLDRAMAKELAPLKLDRARFETSVEALADDKAGAAGLDKVRFLVSTNPGAPLGSLTQIASGGELARFILALKVCLAEKESLATMIFDEVDRGVGGAVSDAVGQRLSRLSSSAQVLVVTHSPQVAAKANQHLRVEKTVVRDGQTRTHISELSDDERQEEIARMLSAAKVTDEARAAAASLLADDLAAPTKTGTTG